MAIWTLIAFIKTIPYELEEAAIVATAPIIVLVLLCQKKIVSGLTSGAIKG